MAKREYTKARQEANARYDGKTYRLIGLKLRIEEDADILSDLDEAKEEGLNNREWVRRLFEGRK